MSKKTDRMVLDFIKRQFRPYGTHDEFRRGFAAYQAGDCRNPNEFGVAAAKRCQKAVAA